MEGWKKSRLGEVCDIQIGGTPARSKPELWDTNKETSNLWVSIREMNKKRIDNTEEYISDLGILKSNAKLIKKGTLLLSFKLSIGKVSWAGKDLYTNEAIAALVKPSLVPSFLFYGLQFWNLLQDVDQAIKGATLNKEKLKNVSFIHPKSKIEQRKIAEVLSKVDKAIAQTEKLIAKYKRIKTGMMQDLLTKGIDENGNIRSEETHEFKDSLLGRIPVEWEISNLLEIGFKKEPYIKTGPFGSALKSEHWTETGIPVVTIGSLGEATFILSELLYVSIEKAESMKQYSLKVNDILFSRVADVGRSLVITNEQNGWIMSSNFMRIRLDNEKYKSQFLHVIIKFSHEFHKQANANINASGRSVTNTETLNSFVFPKPNLKEQKEICLLVKTIDNSIIIEEHKLSKLQKLKTALMQDLLTGKVRVTDLNLIV
jgi:type I restriction enzyme, S subunit